MRRTQLPISALPAWCKLNDCSFIDTAVKNLGEKGFGLVTESKLNSEDTFEPPTLLVIPHDLVLSAQAIEEHAKVDHHFRQLLDAAGGKSLRGDALLFLLMQITIASLHQGQNVGLSNPWTEYVKMLPNVVPLPTMWTEAERVMLTGTSLESAVVAKMSALHREFESLREDTAKLSWCHEIWWEQELLDFTDWLCVDAWYRSRSLELPISGHAMVPGLDMANHSVDPNAYYDQAANGAVRLLLRPDMNLALNSEITISYGVSKSPSELLFSYGFVDEKSTTRKMVVDLTPFPDDPLGKAKLAVYAGSPVVRIIEEDGEIQWESPFLYLMCLNEEDGLEFKVLQQTDGSRSPLRMFWQGSDVTNDSTSFESLIKHHDLMDVFKLRANVVLLDRLQSQLERIYGSEDDLHSLSAISSLTPDRQSAALRLRSLETAILEATFASVDKKKTQLMDSVSVLKYLGSMEAGRPEQEQANHEEEEDFS